MYANALKELNYYLAIDPRDAAPRGFLSIRESHILTMCLVSLKARNTSDLTIRRISLKLDLAHPRGLSLGLNLLLYQRPAFSTDFAVARLWLIATLRPSEGHMTS